MDNTSKVTVGTELEYDGAVVDFDAEITAKQQRDQIMQGYQKQAADQQAKMEALYAAQPTMVRDDAVALFNLGQTE